MGKRIPACFFIVMLLCCALFSCATASSVEGWVINAIPDKGIGIAVPEEFIVFNYTDTEVDSSLELLGITAEALKAKMQPNGVVLYAFPSDMEYDINVVVTDSPKVAT